MLRQADFNLDAILFFDLPDGVATERMLKRARMSSAPTTRPR